MSNSNEQDLEYAQSVYTWLNAYTEKFQNMTEAEKRKENRVDYIEESQLYADYLDYVEEWEWHQKEQKHSLLQSFIYAQSKNHRKMECTCEQGFHIFTTTKDPAKGDVVTDSPHIFIYGKCWYKNLSKKVDEVLEELKQPQILLPKTLESIMIQVSRWRMVTQDQTPYLLPLDAFEQIWWNKTITGEESKMAKILLNQLNSLERKQIKILENQNTLQIQKHNWKKLLDFPHSDHGLHALRSATTDADFRTIWSFMNKWRNKIQQNSAIKLEELDRKIQLCKHCQGRQYPAALSVPGIYYAPPGCGKTTAQEKEVLVGFDTDWLGVGPTWKEYSVLFQMKIPIITNQYTIFSGCGLKLYGIRRNNIRKDTHGRPLTTQTELKAYQEQHQQDVFFMKVKSTKHLSDYAINLQIMAHLQLMIKNYAINLLPFYANEMDEEWLNKYPKLLRANKS